MAGQRTTVRLSAHGAPQHRSSNRRPRMRATLLAAALTASSVATHTSGTADAATAVVALWNLDEPAGATTMVDSGPYGLHGVVGPAIQTGVVHAGALGYRWSNVSPTAPPAKPERIAYVPSSNVLNPDAGDYAVEFRYRTTRSFGNVVQKGQNATTGGYWKFEQPNGNMTCLFKGGNGQQRAIRSPIQTNDGNWHTIRCERTSTEIRLFIDGVRVGRLSGPTGTISNNQRISIGGKSNCDQIKVTCDYFVGDIDYVKIEKAGSAPAPNQPPVASFTSSCIQLTCSFDSAASNDPDGSIVQRRWSFGDGTTASGSTAQRTYAAAGSYTVTLTVTDDDGATGTTQRTVTPGAPAAAISYVGGTTASRNASTHSTTVPVVQTGDALLLFVTTGAPAGVGAPTGVTGWTPVDSAVSTTYGSTTLWKKVASSGDGGRTVTVTLSSSAKANISVVAYRGASTADPVAVHARSVHSSGSTRTTPVVSTVPTGSHAVSYWAHRDSTTTALTPPGGVATRLAASQSGGGRITMLLADSAGPVNAGSYGGLTATAQASSSFATSWTVILRPG